MNIHYRMATPDDAQILTEARIVLLDEGSGPLTNAQKTTLYINNKEQFKTGLNNGTLIAILAFDNNNFIGTCSATLYSVLPGIRLPDGKQAYIQNMYVVPAHRRKGVGKEVLTKTINECVKQGYKRFTLYATEMGKELYKNFGFQSENVSLTHMVYHAEG